MMHWWQVRERWSFEHGGAFIDRETTQEENIRIQERHDELRWKRVRLRWATKHPPVEFNWETI